MKRAVRKFKETVEIRSSLINRVRSNRYLPMAVLVAVVLTAACVHIWQRVRVLDLVYEVSLLRQENQALGDDLRKVYSDVSSLSMSARIESYASDTLGLQTVPAEKLFTLVPRDGTGPEADDFERVLTAMKRMATYLPAVTETQASAGELRNPRIDSLARSGGTSNATDQRRKATPRICVGPGRTVLCCGDSSPGAPAGLPAP